MSRLKIREIIKANADRIGFKTVNGMRNVATGKAKPKSKRKAKLNCFKTASGMGYVATPLMQELRDEIMKEVSKP